MSIVVKAERNEKGLIIHEMDNGEKKVYQDIRGGISWPLMDENLPAYYCIYGEERVPTPPWAIGTPLDREQPPGRGKLCFLSEYEAPDALTSLDVFFQRLTDDTTRYLCEHLYGITEKLKDDDYSGYAEALQTFVYEKKTPGRLEEAPWVDQPALGIYHINAWIKKGLLEIPQGSLLLDQLRMVQTDAVKELPRRLNAVNALRFVICSFEKNRPNRNSGFVPDRGPVHYGGSERRRL
ncbi:MAG: hypothetical protein ABSE25_00490 [Syntrophorhabdales bacterium]|jgi:hypothetical protein